MSDPQLSLVLSYTINGWPRYAQHVTVEILEYYTVLRDLSVVNGKVIYGNGIVIPAVLRSQILDRVHNGHQGMSKHQERANMSVWRPAISYDIKNKVRSHVRFLPRESSKPKKRALDREMQETILGLEFSVFIGLLSFVCKTIDFKTWIPDQ